MMGKLKGLVKNKAQAEASMAEAQLLREQVFYYNLQIAGPIDTGGHSWHAIGQQKNSFSKHGVGLQYAFRSERETKAGSYFSFAKYRSSGLVERFV
jgi:hypothetical protein